MATYEEKLDALYIAMSVIGDDNPEAVEVLEDIESRILGDDDAAIFYRDRTKTMELTIPNREDSALVPEGMAVLVGLAMIAGRCEVLLSDKGVTLVHKDTKETLEIPVATRS